MQRAQSHVPPESARLNEARAASHKAVARMMGSYEKLTLAEVATREAAHAVELQDMRLGELFVLMDELEAQK